eukprot:5485831-Pyramimonas_sp.AAC.1
MCLLFVGKEYNKPTRRKVYDLWLLKETNPESFKPPRHSVSSFVSSLGPRCSRYLLDKAHGDPHFGASFSSTMFFISQWSHVDGMSNMVVVWRQPSGAVGVLLQYSRSTIFYYSSRCV